MCKSDFPLVFGTCLNRARRGRSILHDGTDLSCEFSETAIIMMKTAMSTEYFIGCGTSFVLIIHVLVEFWEIKSTLFLRL